MRPRLLLLFSASLLLLPIAATAGCPTNTLSQGCGFEGWAGTSTDAAGMFDFSLTPNLAPWTVGTSCPTACYDLSKGVLLSAAHYGPFDDCTTFADVHDTYELSGLPPGGPYSFVAELWVTGTIAGNGQVSARMNLDGGPDVQNASSAASVDYKLTTPVVRSVGQPFTMSFHLGSAGAPPIGSTVSSQAVVHFSGLPQGAAIVSCQNYDLPVATQSLTWGSVKASYR